MRKTRFLLAAALIALAPACGSQNAEAQVEQRAPEDGRLMPPEKVAEHVWVMRQPDRLWSAVIGNVLIVEQSDGIVLFDSGGTGADGRDIVAAVARLSSKPVKAIAISHWHNDHPLGVSGILESFPNARVIATGSAAEAMKTALNTGVGRPDPATEAERYRSALERARDYAALARDASLPEALRREYRVESGWIARRAERQRGNFVVLPTETFTDRLLLDDPKVPVELRFLGAANTGGDAIAWLPRQRLVATGDAVVLPTPYGFTVSVAPWLAWLDRLEALDFATLVPGHGPVQRDRAYLGTLRFSMENIRAQANALAAQPIDEDAAWSRFDKTGQRRRFDAADSEWRRLWLDGYWLEGMFRSAFKEARGEALDAG